MSAKVYLDSNGITRDSFALAKRIFDSGFRPDIIIALWRGGTPVGIAVHEFLNYKGLDCYHTVVKTCSYTGIEQHGEPVIENLDYVLQRLTADSKVLVVDDIFDSGSTARVIRDQLSKVTTNLRFATLYYKPRRNTAGFKPDYYLKEVDSWLVFPHELMGLTPAEIKEKDIFVCSLLGL
jgi:hypothetical protein